jgi:hypothetical protein
MQVVQYGSRLKKGVQYGTLRESVHSSVCAQVAAHNMRLMGLPLVCHGKVKSRPDARQGMFVTYPGVHQLSTGVSVAFCWKLFAALTQLGSSFVGGLA